MNVDTDTQWAYLVGMRVSVVFYNTKFLGSNFVCRTFSIRKRIMSRPKSVTLRALTSPTRRYGALTLAMDMYLLLTSSQYYDPRVWIREGEKTLSARVKEACADLGNVGHL